VGQDGLDPDGELPGIGPVERLVEPVELAEVGVGALGGDFVAGVVVPTPTLPCP
jgi:hypothetical protein